MWLADDHTDQEPATIFSPMANAFRWNKDRLKAAISFFFWDYRAKNIIAATEVVIANCKILSRWMLTRHQLAHAIQFSVTCLSLPANLVRINNDK